MKPDKFSVYQLFERTQRYVVPLFQRPYVWNRNEQWSPLWEDITHKADQILERASRRDVIGAHFLGAAVINEIRTFGKEVPAFEIIDGQQRLTTLQILLSAFRNFLHNVGYDDFDSDLEKLTVNLGTRKSEEEIYKVWPTIADRIAFEIVFSHNSPSELQDHLKANGIHESRLIEAYIFFYEAIDEYIQYGENDDEIDSPRYDHLSEMGISRIDALMEALKRHLEIVVIELEEDDDPQVIFETLNARGVPLLPSDLIRNFVFLEASRRGENTEVLYRKYWYHYDNPQQGDAEFWKKEMRQGRLTRPRIDLFFFHYITMKVGREIKIASLFGEFRRWWLQIADALIDDHLAELNKYSDIFRRLVEIDTDTRLGVFMNRLETMNVGTLYPILFYLLGECDHLPENELQGILIDLESYLVRRMICSMTTKNYNRNFLIVLRDLKRATVVDRKAFREILAGFEGDTARWPTDDEFHHSWLNAPIYRRLAQMRVRMILEAIDLQMETRKQEQLHIKTALTIEHIFPQNPDQRVWPQLGTDDADVIHTFGNLTLLTDALNSSVSNGAFVRKRAEIARHSKLRMNVYFQDLLKQETWDMADIAARGEMMYRLAKEIWPRPAYKTTTRLLPGQERAINSLVNIADQNGVGRSFKLLLHGAITASLYPRTSTSSIMYTSLQNKNRCLFTTWVTPVGGLLRVYVASGAFSEFLEVSDDVVEAAIGQEGWRSMTSEDAKAFVEALKTIII